MTLTLQWQHPDGYPLREEDNVEFPPPLPDASSGSSLSPGDLAVVVETRGRPPEQDVRVLSPGGVGWIRFGLLRLVSRGAGGRE